MKRRGFTLFEILVAIFILAIIGIVMMRALHSAMNAKIHMEKNTEQLENISLTMSLLQNDINMMINRSITIAGNQWPALLLNDDAANSLDFTRAGIRNPLGELRSNLLRVEYRHQQDQLIRGVWSVLDSRMQIKPLDRILLTHVTQVQWQFLASNNRFYSRWPAEGVRDPLPKAIQITLTFDNQHVIQQLFVVNNAQNSPS